MDNTPEKKEFEPLIDAKKAGEILGVSPQTVYRMVTEYQINRIPHLVLTRGKRKNTIRFRPSSLERWLKTKEVK